MFYSFLKNYSTSATNILRYAFYYHYLQMVNRNRWTLCFLLQKVTESFKPSCFLDAWITNNNEKNLVTARGRYHSCNHRSHPWTNCRGPYYKRTTEGVRLVSKLNLQAVWKIQGHHAKTSRIRINCLAENSKHWLLLLLLTTYCSYCCYKTIPIWTFHRILFELINCLKKIG